MSNLIPALAPVFKSPSVQTASGSPAAHRNTGCCCAEHRVSGGHRQEVYTVPVSIGSRQGYLHEDHNTRAAIEVAPGKFVVFAFVGPSGTAPSAIRFEDILANVIWASDPADEATWLAITDWAN